MSRRVTGKQAVGAGLISFAAVGIVAGFHWEELATQCFLRRLRADPQLLLEYWARPAGDPRRSAVTLFVAEPAGGPAVVHQWTQEALGGDPELEMLQAKGDFPAELRGALKDATRALVFTQARSARGAPSRGFAAEWRKGSAMVSGPAALRPIPDDLMELVAGRELQLPDYPDLRFRVLPLEEAKSVFLQSAKWYQPSDLRYFGHAFDSYEEPYACVAYVPHRQKESP